MIQYKKATTLAEVNSAVRLDLTVSPDDNFFTDFSDVRGEFEDESIYRNLDVDSKFRYTRDINNGNKIKLFLAGMRGSGKTSELTKISKKLQNKDCFFCVTCNLDDGLSMDDMEYMDILIFQTERLFEEIEHIGLNIDSGTIESLQKWFSERVEEVNKAIKREGGFEVEIGAQTPSIFSFIKIAAKLKANLTGSKENADKIRTVFKNNFIDFARKFNEVIEKVNLTLRQKDIAQEILFIVDGLEKTATTEIRKKIIFEETNRIRQINVNTIFTLPIELMSDRRKLEQFSVVTSFPFVKIQDRKGKTISKAVDRFRDFVYKRIDRTLFENDDVVTKAILMSGGSPRELLRILQYANIFADEDFGKITMADLDKAIKKLAVESSQYLSKEDLNKLKELRIANEKNLFIPYDDRLQALLEKLIVLEYNDGSYKRVNPIVELSPLYQQFVDPPKSHYSDPIIL
jgi:signal recognition particle GTPase